MEYSLIEAARACECGGEAVVSHRIIGIDSQCSLVFLDRIRKVARHPEEHSSETEMLFGALGTDRDDARPEARIIQPIAIAGIRAARKDDHDQAHRHPRGLTRS